jgi:hypothetical protein
MSESFRRRLLRANAVFLMLAALGAWFQMDFPASFNGSGPLGPLIAHERALGIGFVEAHGLALILAVLLWRAPAARSWHLTAAAIHLLLGVCNVVFWQLFVATGTLPMGWVTTVVHGLLFVLQALAALAAPRMPAATTVRE